MVNPDTRARHRQAIAETQPDEERSRLLARHRLRTVMKSYGLLHLIRVAAADRGHHDGDGDHVVAHRSPWPSAGRDRRVDVEPRPARRHPPSQQVPRADPRSCPTPRCASSRRGGAHRCARCCAGPPRTRGSPPRPRSGAASPTPSRPDRSAPPCSPGRPWSPSCSSAAVSSSPTECRRSASSPRCPTPRPTSCETFASGWRTIGLGTTAAAPTAFAGIGFARHRAVRADGPAPHAARPACRCSSG